VTSPSERSILELLTRSPERETFRQADLLFDGRPNPEPAQAAVAAAGLL
jgi:hypothetical protein